MKEREWKARIPPPLAAQVKDPCAPLVTWRSCLVSTSFPFVATSYFNPGRVTLDEILSDTAFHTLSGLYSAIFPFRVWLRFELGPFTAGASAFPSGFLEVNPTLSPTLFHRLATKVIQTTIVALQTAHFSMSYWENLGNARFLSAPGPRVRNVRYSFCEEQNVLNIYKFVIRICYIIKFISLHNIY